MTPKLAVCILSGEAPLNGASLCVSRLLPCVDFCLQGIAIGDASIQALAAQDTNLDLRHIEPARVFWCVVKLYAAQEFVGRALTQHIIEAFPEMGVEVVQHQMNAACPGIHTREQFVDERDEVVVVKEAVVTADATLHAQISRGILREEPVDEEPDDEEPDDEVCVKYMVLP